MNVVTDVNVSVPLRGLWFLSETLSTLTHALERVCFRPLTGIVVLIGKREIIYTFLKLSFRPLTGIVVLILYAANTLYRKFDGSFRPLTGIVVLITSEYGTTISILEEKFPSPYGDCGSYRLPILSLDSPQSTVSVPLRGLWFLSHKMRSSLHCKSL